MGRIYTKRKYKQRLYAAPVENITRLEVHVPSPLEEVQLEVLSVLLSYTGVDYRTATFVPSIDTIAEITGNPIDLVHAALVELIEDGNLAYRFDGSIEVFPNLRRRARLRGGAR